MPLEEINGLRIHTQTLGTSGPAAVMLHGMIIGSLSTWYFSVASALAADMRVLLYDLRGHGLSERPPSGYGVRVMAEDLGCLIRKHALDHVTLVGHSFGAVVALRFAISHPEIVDRLVLVEPTLPLTSPDWLDALETSSEETILDLFPPTQREILQLGGRRADRLAHQITSLGQETTLIDDLQADPDISDAELEAVKCPVLLCNGTDAADFTGSTRERLVRLLPNASLRMFDAGHNVPLEAPQPLAEAIREFVHT